MVIPGCNEDDTAYCRKKFLPYGIGLQDVLLVLLVRMVQGTDRFYNSRFKPAIY